MPQKISFVTTVPGLLDIQECLPIPARKAFPSWLSKIPPTDPIFESSTVRRCPGIIDYLSSGFVLPMWADTRLQYNPSTGYWQTHSGHNGDLTRWETHGKEQFLDYVQAQQLGREVKLVFKAVSPWRIITPPGWSVYQIPLHYHFDNQFSVMGGVIDTDIYHEINQQVMYFGDGEEVLIERGTPLVMYVPFKRGALPLEVRSATDNDNKLFQKPDAHLATKFVGHGAYRKLQKDRENSKNGRSLWRTK